MACGMTCSCLGGLGESHLTILCAEGEGEEGDQVPPYEDRLGPDGWVHITLTTSQPYNTITPQPPKSKIPI